MRQLVNGNFGEKLSEHRAFAVHERSTNCDVDSLKKLLQDQARFFTEEVLEKVWKYLGLEETVTDEEKFTTLTDLRQRLDPMNQKRSLFARENEDSEEAQRLWLLASLYPKSLRPEEQG